MKRRQLLTRMVQGFAGVGLAFLAYPFVRSLLPGRADDVNLRVNIAMLDPGQSKRISYRGQSVIVMRRPHGWQVPAAEALKDPDSIESAQPAFADGENRSLRNDLFVVVANCTHLGCEVNNTETGFECPCHSSRFDLAGRAYREAAAPLNLKVPNYRYVSRQMIELMPDEGIGT